MPAVSTGGVRLVSDTNTGSPSHRAAVVTAATACKPVGTVGLVMLARPQWLRASGSRTVASPEFPVGLTGHLPGDEGAGPQSCAPLPHRAEAHFLRSLASITGGRYHCPVAQDTLPHIHGLLTGGCEDEEVGGGLPGRHSKTCTGELSPPTCRDLLFSHRSPDAPRLQKEAGSGWGGFNNMMVCTIEHLRRVAFW